MLNQLGPIYSRCSRLTSSQRENRPRPTRAAFRIPVARSCVARSTPQLLLVAKQVTHHYPGSARRNTAGTCCMAQSSCRASRCSRPAAPSSTEPSAGRAWRRAAWRDGAATTRWRLPAPDLGLPPAAATPPVLLRDQARALMRTNPSRDDADASRWDRRASSWSGLGLGDPCFPGPAVVPASLSRPPPLLFWRRFLARSPGLEERW